MKTRLPLLLSAALLVGLTACNRSEPAPEPAPYNEPIAEEPAPEPEPRPEPEPVTPVSNAAETVTEAVPPPEPTPQSEQMLEDAEATGMTARVAREDTATDENDTRDVEEK
ncbi:MAG TPA: hypothetical protein VF649_02940 [Sphingomonas sp.]|jgi:hypothetical protein|uniref:hypothetical protein n=1 Tax=Sphingomonas sp. TaxID=28214 RepID=UPI002ED90B03